MKITILHLIGALLISSGVAIHQSHQLALSKDRELELWYQLYPLASGHPILERENETLRLGIMSYRLWPDCSMEEREAIQAILPNIEK